MKTIVVASKNPVKINATKRGFEKIFPKETFEIRGISVPSGVPDQPMTDQETLEGAINRTHNAQAKMPHADFWVGLEGGVQPVEDSLMAFAWVAVLGKGKIGKARSAAFFLPPKVVRLIHEGKELGEADDIVFGHRNSKQQGGAIGLLTNQVSNRTEVYAETVMLALVPFINPTLY